MGLRGLAGGSASGSPIYEYAAAGGINLQIGYVDFLFCPASFWADAKPSESKVHVYPIGFNVGNQSAGPDKLFAACRASFNLETCGIPGAIKTAFFSKLDAKTTFSAMSSWIGSRLLSWFSARFSVLPLRIFRGKTHFGRDFSENMRFLARNLGKPGEKGLNWKFACLGLQRFGLGTSDS